MFMDVKNSLDKVLAVIAKIQNVGIYPENINEIFRQDVSDFIQYISKSGAEERIQIFGEFYMQGEMPAPAKTDSALVSPLSANIFREFDQRFMRTQKIQTSSILLSFFAELGIYYLHSDHDRESIDSAKLKKYLGRMKEYLEKKTLSSGENVRLQKNTVQESVSEDTAKKESEAEEESLDELMGKLNSLIGLNGVKQEVNSLINLLKINRMRKERGLETPDVSKHLVFSGNPGTGKTTVARLISKIYKQLGVLDKGQLIEVDRSGLVAGYVGQTALKTKEKIDEAMGGILFIDEAYTLAKGSNDFGQEAIDTILKAMEDNRENFVVIAAGYPEPMEKFLESNPGLRSRFNKNIFFEDYKEEELCSIFSSFCDRYGLHLRDDAEEAFRSYLYKLCLNKPANFANGREMRNLFEKAVSNQANRLAGYSTVSEGQLIEMTKDDLELNS